MNLYNKNNINVARIASKDTYRQALSGVLVLPDKTIATDSYMLLEVGVPKKCLFQDFPALPTGDLIQEKKPLLVDAKVFGKMKAPKHKDLPVLNTLGVKSTNKKFVYFAGTDLDNEVNIAVPLLDNKYPEYEKIMMKDREPTMVMRFSAKRLKAILGIVGDVATLNKENSVTIKVYGNDEPIVIESDGPEQYARGLVAPIIL